MRENNPVMNMLYKVTDVLLLNILVLIGCLPIITIGASLTAGHFVALRLKRDEGTVFGDFCRSFKENFKQATIVWLIFVAIIAGVLVLLWFYGAGSIPLSIASLVVLLFVFFLTLWVFPVLSRFVYDTRALFLNSFVLCFRHLWRTLGMAAVAVLPVIAVVLSLYTLPFVIVCGIALPMYICAKLYLPVFLDMEEMVTERLN